MSTATQPPYDKLCGDRHWSWEPHKYPKDLKVRKMAKEFTSPIIKEVVRSQPASVPVTKPRTVSVTAGPRYAKKPVVSVTGTYDDGPAPDRTCIQCGEAFKGKGTYPLDARIGLN